MDSQSNFEEKANDGMTNSQYFKLHYRAIVIKAECYSYKI